MHKGPSRSMDCCLIPTSYEDDKGDIPPLIIQTLKSKKGDKRRREDEMIKRRGRQGYYEILLVNWCHSHTLAFNVKCE